MPRPLPTAPPAACSLESEATPGRRTEPILLRGSATLTVHTYQARRLVAGRNRKAGRSRIPGLFAFAEKLRALKDGVAAGDPRAVAHLERAAEALAKAETELAVLLGELEEAGREADGFDSGVPRSPRPVEHTLRFAHALAYRGAVLVARFDRLVRRALAAQYMGVLSGPEVERIVATGGRLVRRVFHCAADYQAPSPRPVLDRVDTERGSGIENDAAALDVATPLDPPPSPDRP